MPLSVREVKPVRVDLLVPMLTHKHRRGHLLVLIRRSDVSVRVVLGRVAGGGVGVVPRVDDVGVGWGVDLLRH